MPPPVRASATTVLWPYLPAYEVESAVFCVSKPETHEHQSSPLWVGRGQRHGRSSLTKEL